MENMMKVKKSPVAKVTQFAVIILAGLHVVKEVFQIIRVCVQCSRKEFVLVVAGPGLSCH